MTFPRRASGADPKPFDPFDLPDGFQQWLVKYLEANPPGLLAGDIIGAVRTGTIVDSDIRSTAAIGIDKLADPGTGKVIGSVSSAAAAVYPPGYEYAYNEFTSNATSTATTEATAATIVTASAVTFDGSTTVMIEFFSANVNVGTAARWTNFWLYDGSSSIGEIGEIDSPTAGYGGMAICRRRITPAAATKTYSVRASVGGGAATATIVGGAGGNGNMPPGYIRISKI